MLESLVFVSVWCPGLTPEGRSRNEPLIGVMSVRIIVARIIALLSYLLCAQAYAAERPFDSDVTLGGCDAAYETARAAWTQTLDSSSLVSLRDGRCSFAKLEYLRAAWATAKPGLTDYAARGSTKLHAAAALVDRKAVGSVSDPQWLAGFLSTYGANGLDVFRLFHAGELPTEVVAAADVAGLAEAANACDQVCRMLRVIAAEPQDVPGKVKYYLEMANPFAIARLVDLGPSIRHELLSSAESDPDIFKRQGRKITAYFALRRAGDSRHEQVVASGLVSKAAKRIVDGERLLSRYRPDRIDLRSTLSYLFLRAWGW